MNRNSRGNPASSTVQNGLLLGCVGGLGDERKKALTRRVYGLLAHGWSAWSGCNGLDGRLRSCRLP